MNPIPGFPGYLVTDDGRVWSEKGKGRWLKPAQLRGYPTVSLYADGKKFTRTVHSLVALAFLGERPAGKPHIRHLDGDQTNNAVGNLKYGTNLENAQDSIAHGTHANARKTYCAQGHPLSGENLYVTPSTGHRQCRECRRQAKRDRYARRREQQLPMAA